MVSSSPQYDRAAHDNQRTCPVPSQTVQPPAESRYHVLPNGLHSRQLHFSAPLQCRQEPAPRSLRKISRSVAGPKNLIKCSNRPIWIPFPHVTQLFIDVSLDYRPECSVIPIVHKMSSLKFNVPTFLGELVDDAIPFFLRQRFLVGKDHGSDLFRVHHPEVISDRARFDPPAGKRQDWSHKHFLPDGTAQP